MSAPIEILNVFGPVKDLIIFFVDRRDQRSESENVAFATLLDACTRTRQYILQDNFNSNSDLEMAKLWQDCAVKLRPIYPHWAGMATEKSNYWATSGYKDVNKYAFVATLDEMLQIAKEI